MRPFFIISILFILSILSACTPTSPLMDRSTSVEIAKEIYFVEKGEEKIRAYLSALQAQSVSLSEVYEEDTYSLDLSIVKSKKLQDKSDQEKQVIVSQITDLLVSQIDYASYYTEILIRSYSQPISKVLEGEGEAEEYSFPMTHWFGDK